MDGFRYYPNLGSPLANEERSSFVGALKGWIERRLVRAAKGGKAVTWVKAHGGILRKELEGYRAKKEVARGKKRGAPSIAAGGGDKAIL